MKLAITAGELLSPLEHVTNAVVVIEDGRIAACGSRDTIEIPAGTRVVDYPDAILAPGFVDIHIHGAAGYDVMECSDSGLRRMAEFLAKHGITCFVPTTVTAEDDAIAHALEHLGEKSGQHIGNGTKPCAEPFGVHLEGPFISDARRGVHPPAHIKAPSQQLFETYWKASRGQLRLMTIAPEVPGATELISSARSKGVRSSVGHSNATFEEAEKGIESGAVHATHTFNAMLPMEHRAASIVGAVLTDCRISAEIIADGIHVEPAVVDVFMRCKGPELAVLVSDAISATGMPAGKYKLGNFVVEVNGLRCISHGKLAGSVLTLDVAVRNVMSFARWPLANAVRAASLNPARVVGLDDRKGQLKPGYDADIVVLSKSGEVQHTVTAGIGI